MSAIFALGHSRPDNDGSLKIPVQAGDGKDIGRLVSQSAHPHLPLVQPQPSPSVSKLRLLCEITLVEVVTMCYTRAG